MYIHVQYWQATSSRRVPFLASALLHHFPYIILCTFEKWYSAGTGCMPVEHKSEVFGTL